MKMDWCGKIKQLRKNIYAHKISDLYLSVCRLGLGQYLRG